jgi:phosphate transport system substrate-binding protein
MSLTGDVNTLALADLVQVSALNLRTCQIHVIAPHAEGDIYIDRGSVVHAWWGDLVGAEAVYAMLNTPDVGFHVRTGVAAEAQTIAASWQQLVMESARRHDHGSVPQPKARSARADATGPRTTEPRLRPADYSQPLTLGDAMTPRRAGPPRILWIAAAVSLALALGAIGWRVYRPGAARPSATATTTATGTGGNGAVGPVLDASQLTGPGDAPPALLAGTPPSVPRSEFPVAPTIVCRLTIGADGTVRESRVYRSRLELAAFEDAALAAVEKYRFRPARHNGVPVAAAINWPVTFAHADARPLHTLRIKGSDTIDGALTPALARAFRVQHPDLEFAIEALGSKTAFVGLFDGSADLGASSRPVNQDELKQAARLGLTLREYVIAYDGIAVIVHPDNPLHALPMADVARIFTGAVHDWSEVGGAAGPIRVISRPTYSGTHSFFKEKVLRHGNAKGTEEFASAAEIMEDNRKIVEAVAGDHHAVAYVGLGWVAPTVRALGVAARPGAKPIVPDAGSIRDGSYPIYRPLLLYSRGAPSRDGADFLTFILGADGQAIVHDNGFVPIDAPSGHVEAGDVAAGAPIEPTRIPFAGGSARLGDDARARLAEVVQRAHGARLLVIGHSDAEGDPASNHRLALARAQRVQGYLVARGFDASTIEVEAEDADAPLASNANAAGRSQNRRADIFILDLPTPAAK